MNRKGSVMLYGIMLGITIIILALALAPSVAEFNKDARNVSWEDNKSYEVENGTYGSYVGYGNVSHDGLDCDNSSISNYDKATCTFIDLNLFYFIATIIFIGGAVVTAKIIFDG